MAGLLMPAAPLSGDPVALELRRWASEPFEYCALAVLSFVERVRRRRLDPRPRIAGPIAAGRLIERSGGFEALCHRAMAQLGCPATGAPIRGDVGLAELPSGLTACICLGDADGDRLVWAARGDRAVIIQPAKAAAAWRVDCPRHSS